MANSRRNSLETSPDILNEPPDNLTNTENKKSGFQKVIRITIPTVILIFSFISGFIYFFNFDIIARYMIIKAGYPLDIDKMEIHLSGKFNVERLRYAFLNRLGISDQIKLEFIGGSVSSFKLLTSKKLDMDINIKGVKIPFEGGMISGGSWKIISLINNVQKNAQQWDGDVTLSAEDAMIQYTIMNVNYVALVKSAKIKGQIKNNIFQLATSEILTDIAKITLTGNTTIVFPYNVNIQLKMLPLDEFGIKYPDEKNMLSAFTQKNPEITINLTGTIDKLNPQIQNQNP
jgi:hypothetical protein